MQPFLEQMLQLQIFRQFCEERLAMLNDRRGISDEFEMEVVRFQVRKLNQNSQHILSTDFDIHVIKFAQKLLWQVPWMQKYPSV